MNKIKDYFKNINYCTALHISYHSMVFGGGGYYITEVNKTIDRAEKIIKETKYYTDKKLEQVTTKATNLTNKAESTVNKVENSVNDLNKILKKVQDSCDGVSL